MTRAQKLLIVAAVVGCLTALTYFLLFTTAEVPAYLAKPTSSADKRSGETRTALVLKWVRRDALKSGDLILVESRSGDGTASVIRRLGKIQPPDESERSKAGGRGRGRRIAQAILDMDFKPKYWISSEDEADPAGLVRIDESQIKGKVVHTFTKRQR